MKSIEVRSDITSPHCQKKSCHSVFTFEHHWVLQEKKRKMHDELVEEKIGNQSILSLVA